MLVAALTALAVLAAAFITLGWLRGRTVSEAAVPWIDPAVLAAAEPRRGGWRRSAVHAPQLITASEADRARAGRWRGFTPHPGPSGDRARLARLLRETGGPLQINRPVWPVCCQRLATLIAQHCGRERLAAIEAEAGRLDHAFLEGELAAWGSSDAERSRLLKIGWSEVLAEIRAGTLQGRGIAVLRCDACGAVYVASCGP